MPKKVQKAREAASEPRDPDDAPVPAARGGRKENPRRSASLNRDREMEELPRRPNRPRQWRKQRYNEHVACAACLLLRTRFHAMGNKYCLFKSLNSLLLWPVCSGKQPESTYCARAFLVLVNVAGIIFGALILYFGVRGACSPSRTHTTHTTPHKHILTHTHTHTHTYSYKPFSYGLFCGK